MAEPDLPDWIRSVDRERLNDPLLARGAWHGYMQGGYGEPTGVAPMRGRYVLVRWREPTVAVSHADPSTVLELARVIERALAEIPPSTEDVAWMESARLLAEGGAITDEEAQRLIGGIENPPVTDVTAAMGTADEIDLDARLKEGDVIVNRQGVRYTVLGWTAMGKLRMQGEGLRTERACWWTYRSQLPKGYWLERAGVRIR
jgi:hypothetical protein